MTRRYSNRRTVINDLEQYQHKFAKRNRKFIRMYSSPNLKHLNLRDLAEIQTFPYRWGLGDKCYKLAADFYGNPELWWVISWFNQKPTDSHVRPGDLLYIPTPIDDVLTKLGV